MGQTQQTNAPPAAKRGKWVILALLLTLCGPPLYMLLMDRPWIRSTGAVVFALMIAAFILGVVAVRGDKRRWPKIIAALNGVLTGLWTFAFFGLAKLPPTPAALDAAAAPDFTLPDQTGQAVSLSQALADGPVLLVFYRGHW